MASRCDDGTAVRTSREIVTIVGRIMIARITPAAKSPIPNAGPAKIGIHPNVSTMNDSTVALRNGLRTKTPHRPMTTLGIAARSSMTKVRGTEMRRGAYSDRKIAVRRPIGAASTSAIAEEKSVPAMNGRAP
jgi:hypothetical protein